MKLAEFKATKRVEALRAEINETEAKIMRGEGDAEPQYVTSTTPSGIEVFYSWAPRRHYKLRTNADGVAREEHWREVPSVTNVLSVLDKSGALTWWGMKVGVEGVMKLVENDDLLYRGHRKPHCLITTEPDQATVEDIVELMVHRKLTVNHVKDKAADRGVNVHEVLEHWRVGMVPDPELFPETERGYVEGLRSFMDAIDSTAKSSEGEAVTESELMVGSLEHQYAGRFDLVLTLSKPVEVVTKIYPKKKSRVEKIPAGRYLLDLKTSKRVYDTHYLQLEAYEHAAIECGYAPTDYRGVVHVTEDGRYELALNKDWCFEDFLAVRKTYQVMNEREALRILREELDATEVKA